MTALGSRTALEWSPAVLSTLLLIFFSAGFLPHQCLWVDETTQMKGLTLDTGELVRWLAGTDPGRFGLPGDRMPPLSYLAGKAWVSVFGLSEDSLRWMGIGAVALATVLVARTALMLTGLGGSFIAGSIFALSANVITWAVEIRAYPLFLLMSAGAFFCFAKILAGPAPIGRKWGVLLAASLLGAMYTHFYGVVLSIALGSGALFVEWKRKGPILPLAMTLGAAALLSIGLIPFVSASTSMSSGAAPGGNGIRDLARLIYRLVSHPAISVSLLAAGAAGLGMAGLLTVIGADRLRASPLALTWALVLALGLAATAVGGLAAKGFKAYTPSYSIWVLPGLAVLASFAWMVRGRGARWITVGSWILLVAAQLFGAVQLVSRGNLFAHGPHRRLEALVREHGAGSVVVLHENAEFGPAYFPLYYEFGGDLKQYALVTESSPFIKVAPIRPGGLGTPIPIGEVDAKLLLVVRVEWLSAGDLRREFQGVRPPISAGPISRSLHESGTWKLREEAQVAATAGASVHMFGR